VNHVPNFHVSEHFSQCFKVFNPSKSWKQRCTTQHIYISGKISYFLDTNEKQTKLWTRNGSRLWHQKSHEKHAWTLYFLRFVSLTCLVWWGKIKKFEKKNTCRSLLDRPKYGLHFSYIKWLSSKIQGFSDHNSRTTDPNFMLLGANRIVLMSLTDENKTKTSISQKEIIFKGVQRQDFQNSSGRPKYINLYA